MAERVRSLLFSLDAALVRSRGDVAGPDLITIVKQLLDVLRKAAGESDLKRDEKLTCISLAFHSADPDDILSFLTTGAIADSKFLQSSKLEVLKGIYALIKEHHSAAFFQGHEGRILRSCWTVFGQGKAAAGSNVIAHCLKIITLLAKLHPNLLGEQVVAQMGDPKPASEEEQEASSSKRSKHRKKGARQVDIGLQILRTLRELRSGHSNKTYGIGLKSQEYKSGATLICLMYARREIIKETYGIEVADSITHEARQLMRKCEDNLMGDEAPAEEVLAGTFSAITKLLHITEGPFGSRRGKENLFDKLNKVFKSFALGQMSKYALLSKALKFLEQHAKFFADDVGEENEGGGGARAEEPRFLCKDVKATLDYHQRLYNKTHEIRSKTTKIDKHALPALENVLNVLATYVEKKYQRQQAQMRQQQYEEENEVHVLDSDCAYIIDHYTKRLNESPESRADAFTLARGVASFAGLLVAAAGQQGSGLLAQLATLNDRGLSELGFEGHAGPGVGYTAHLKSFTMKWRSAILEAAACVLEKMRNQALDRSALGWVAGLAWEVIDGYYSFTKERPKARQALINALKALSALNSLQPFLSQLVPTALTRAILREDVMDEEVGAEQAAVYAGLWRDVLMGVGPPINEIILGAMFEEIKQLIERLDLTYTFINQASLKEEGGAAEGMGGIDMSEEVLVPRNAVDHEVFLGLVAFSESLLTGFMPEAQIRWSGITAESFVTLSLALPHVSGFYRLLTVLLRSFEAKSALGQGPSLKESTIAPDATPMEIDGGSSISQALLPEAEARALTRLLTHYINKVLQRLDQYQDELLASALTMVLAAPLSLVELARLLPAVRLALTTGVSHAPSARAAVEALERWQASPDPTLYDAFEKTLPQILPLLNLYLYDAQRSDVRDESSAEKEAFQKRLLRLLGRLGGRNQAIIEDTGAALAGTLALDTNASVTLAIPFDEGLGSAASGQVQMDVGALLPRLLRLAERKGDEQVKVLASEAIHALVLFMVGSSATHAGQADPTSELYRSVFPTLLRLALDLNGVTRQLFSCLVPQLVHWFSKARSDHPETLALLDSLTEGLSSPESGPIRAFCAGALVEFLQYAIKQSSKTQMARSPVTVDALITRLERLARHPNRYQRLGGAMALQRAVRFLRDETALVRLYVLRLLETALISLRASHADIAGFATADLLSRLIDGLVKVIIRYLERGMDQAELLKPIDARGKPSCLEDTVVDLWSYAGAVEPAFRTKSLAAFMALVPLLPPSMKKEEKMEIEGNAAGTRAAAGTAAARSWVLAHSQGDVLNTLEGHAARLLVHGLPKDFGLKKNQGGQRTSDEIFVRALETLTAGLDSYLWLFGRGVLHAGPFIEGTEAFQGRDSAGTKRRRGSAAGGGESGGTTILACIRSVLTGIWDQPPGRGGFEEALDLAPAEASRKRNAVALVRTFDLFSLLLEEKDATMQQRLAQRIVAEELWGPSMHRVLAWSLFKPWGLHNGDSRSGCYGTLNRPEEDEVVALNLPEAVRRLLRHWKLLDAAAAAKGGQSFAQTLKEVIESDPSLDPASLPLDLASSDIIAKRWLVNTTSALKHVDLLATVLPNGQSIQALATILLDGLSADIYGTTAAAASSKPLSPSGRRLAGSILFLAVSLGVPLNNEGSSVSLLGKVMDPAPIAPGGISRGEAFRRRFSIEVAEALVVAPEGRVVLRRLAGASGDSEEAEQSRALFVSAIEWLLTRPAMLDQEASEVLHMALEEGAIVPQPSGGAKVEHEQLNAIAIIRRLLRLDMTLPENGGLRVGVGKDERIRSVIEMLLRDEDISLGVKIAAMEMLPPLLPEGVGDEAEAESLLEAIEVLTTGRLFPVTSSYEWAKVKGDPQIRSQDANYLLILRALLNAVTEAGNLGLAIKVIHHYSEGRKHRHYGLLRSSLEAMVRKMVAPGLHRGKAAEEAHAENIRKIASAVLKLVVETRMSHSKKELLLDDLLLPLMSTMPLESLITFLASPQPPHRTLLRSLIPVIAIELPPDQGKDDSMVLFPRIAALTIFRVIYDRFDVDDIKERLFPLAVDDAASSAAASVATPPNLNNIIGKCVPQYYHRPWVERMEVSAGGGGEEGSEGGPAAEPKPIPRPLRRRLAIAAYACAAAMVLKTQQPKIVGALTLEPGKKAGGKPVHWNLLVDRSRRYKFEPFQEGGTNRLMPPSGYPKRDWPAHSFRFISGGTQAYGGAGMMGYSQISQVGSQMLSQSSLGNTQSLGRGEASSSGRDGGRGGRGAGRSTQMSQLSQLCQLQVCEREEEGEEGSRDEKDEEDVKMEAGGEEGFDENQLPMSVVEGSKFAGLRKLKDLNKEPAMAHTLAAIARLAEKTPAGTSARSDALKWLEALGEALISPDCHENARLFVLQAILNEPSSSHLKPWVTMLGAIVLQASVELLINQTRHEGCHYMLCDVADLFVTSWAAFQPTAEQDKAHAVRFICYFVSNAHSVVSTTSITRHNLGFLSALLQLWIANNKDMIRRLEDALFEHKGPMDDIIGLLGTPLGMRGGRHQAAGSEGSQAMRKCVTAVNVLAVLLTSGNIHIFARRFESQAAQIIQLVLNAMQGISTIVYEVAAELAGLILKSLWGDTHYQEGAVPPGEEIAECAKTFADQVRGVLVKRLTESTGTDSKAKDRGPRSLAAIVNPTKGSFLPLLHGDNGYESRKFWRQVVTSVARMRNLQVKAMAGILLALAEARKPADLEIYDELAKSLPGFLADTSRCYIRGTWKPAIQLAAVRLFRRALDDMRTSNGQPDLSKIASELLGGKYMTQNDAHSLVKLATSEATDLEVREEVFTLLMELYHKFRNEGGTASSPTSNSDSRKAQVKEHVKERVIYCLVKGLSDPDDRGLEIEDNGDAAAAGGGAAAAVATEAEVKGIRRRVMDFWDGEARLGRDPLLRLQSILSQIFHPQCSASLLPSATYLLLSLSLASGRSKDLLFKDPLEDIKFSDIDVSQGSLCAGGFALSANRTMTPMFSILRTQALSQSSQGLGAVGTQSIDQSQVRRGWIRATQQGGGDMAWTQTQGVESMLTTPTQTGPKESAFIINLPRAGGGTAAAVAMPPPPPRKRKTPPTEEEPSSRSKAGGDGEDEEEQGPALSSSKRQRKVVVYRRYRQGELPDIQIPLRDVLRPLQGLCLRDGSIARQVFVLLFGPLFNTSDSSQRGSILKGLKVALEGAMGETELVAGLHSAYRTAMGMVGEDDSIEDGESCKVTPRLAAESGIRSLNYHSGVLLVEEQLLRAQGLRGGGGRAAARGHHHRHSRLLQQQRAQGVSSSKEPGPWLELARLYRALGEGDILMGLIEKATGEGKRKHLLVAEKDAGSGGAAASTQVEDTTAPSTRRALELELDGDFAEAQEEYHALIVEGQGGEASEEEIEMWEARRRECMRRLGSWDALRSEAERVAFEEAKSADTYDGIWAYEKEREAKGLGEGLFSLWVESVVHLYPEQKNQRKEDIESLAFEEENTERRHRLERSLLWVLATGYLYQGDHARALSTIDQAYRTFVEGWSGLHPCAESARKARLEGLQYIAEMEDALLVMRRGSRAAARARLDTSGGGAGGGAADSNTSNPIDTLIKRWETARAPTIGLDGPSVWSKVGLLRDWCLTLRTSTSSSGSGGRIHSSSYHRSQAEEEEAADIQRQGARLRHGIFFYSLAAESAVGHRDAAAATAWWKRVAQDHNQMIALVDQHPEVGPLPNPTVAQLRIACSLDRLKLERKLGRDFVSAAVRKSLQSLAPHERAQAQAKEAGKPPPLWSRAARVLKGAGEKVHELSPQDRLQVHQLEGEWFELAYRLAVGTWAENEEVLQTVGQQYYKVWHNRPGAQVDPRSMRQEWLRIAYQNYQQAAAQDQEVIAGPPAAAKAAVRFAGFCDHLSSTSTTASSSKDGSSSSSSRSSKKKQEEDLETGGEFSAPVLAAQAVKQYLRSLALSPAEAPQALPRLIDLIRSKSTAGNNARAAFIDSSPSVPSWVFLGIASQLLAGLRADAAESDAVLPIILRMAIDYPQAIYFPYQVTKESLTITDLAKSQCIQTVLAPVSPLLERFAHNISLLVHPQTKWSGLAMRIRRMVIEKVKVPEIKEVYVQWRNSMEAGVHSTDRGHYNRQWIENQLRKKIDGVLGRNGEHFSIEGFTKLVNDKTLAELDNKEMGTLQERLDKYSTWLASYQLVTGQDVRIEVPGQYNSSMTFPPRPELHAHVASVDPMLLTLGSKQRPKRIVFHGDNEKSYAFLVKGGEDTRQDERIEQLFEAMNTIMQADSACQQAHLSCRTYKIIPLSSSLGLIEWVADTKVLKNVIFEGLKHHFQFNAASGGAGAAAGDGGRGHRAKATDPEDFYATLQNEYAARFGGKIQAYHADYSKMDAKDAQALHSRLQDKLPWDLIRRYLMLMAPAPEAFITVRSTFAKSLATFSICSYIAGVGDRHLENFLLDTTTGGLVGIDFGFAFGLGPSALPVPELIPFRLTRQLTNVLQPLDSEGLLKTSMTHVLRALRGGKQMLLSIMEIYLKDVIVDWSGAAKGREMWEECSKDLSSLGEVDEKAANTWEPLRKILIARDKLDGVDPVEVLLDDLNQNPHVRKFKSLEAITRVARGERDRPRAIIARAHHHHATTTPSSSSSSSSSKRASSPSSPSAASASKTKKQIFSVAEQVEALVDLATDANVLVRQFVGLAPFV